MTTITGSTNENKFFKDLDKAGTLKVGGAAGYFDVNGNNTEDAEESARPHLTKNADGTYLVTVPVTGEKGTLARSAIYNPTTNTWSNAPGGSDADVAKVRAIADSSIGNDGVHLDASKVHQIQLPSDYNKISPPQTPSVLG